ncbi:hypothetical protein B0H13DRAFT_1921058 [Mycena leptocephala]|nr:hypothetical protein B0H13DRAFT_1921058 [Mycena leptocephala]
MSEQSKSPWNTVFSPSKVTSFTRCSRAGESDGAAINKYGLSAGERCGRTKTNAVAPAAPTTSASVEPTTETTATIPATVGPRIAIVVYSMYGQHHQEYVDRCGPIRSWLTSSVAEVRQERNRGGCGSATMFQVPETLPEEVLTKMYAAPKPAFRIITPEELAKYDAFLMGIPTLRQLPRAVEGVLGLHRRALGVGCPGGEVRRAFVSTAGPGGGHIARESDQKSSKTLYIEHIYLPTWTYHRYGKDNWRINTTRSEEFPRLPAAGMAARHTHNAPEDVPV